MEHTKEEILQAVETIKDICENPPDGSCCTCPFEKDGGCYIKSFILPNGKLISPMISGVH